MENREKESDKQSDQGRRAAEKEVKNADGGLLISLFIFSNAAGV